MNNFLNVSTSPHIRQNISTKSVMLDVIIALIPTTIFSICYFGIKALILILTTLVSAVIFEWGFCKLLKREQSIYDLSAMVTGLILALNLPLDLPLWMAIIGSFFAIIITKELFGGLGQNFMNPALAGRCFLLISFASKMTNFTVDSVTSATPLFIMKSSESLELISASQINLNNLFFGFIPGSIGEVSKICLLIGAIYLLIRKVISIRIPLITIFTFSLFLFFFGKYKFNLTYVLYQILSGGLIFGVFFMATDYVTSPITKNGQIIFAIIIGFLTFIFRTFGNTVEGVSYAILIANILVPLIEKYTIPKAFGMESKIEK